MNALHLSRPVYDGMIGHARLALPDEAVGLLAGVAPGYATHRIALPNLGGPRFFLADPYSQYRAESWMAENGLSLQGIYHSHPGGGAGLSQVDLSFAHLRSCPQVVIALERPDGKPMELRAFRLLGGEPVEIELVLVA